jgi:hypothetical protein
MPLEVLLWGSYLGASCVRMLASVCAQADAPGTQGPAATQQRPRLIIFVFLRRCSRSAQEV